MFAELKRLYPNHRIAVSIESENENADNAEQSIREKQFYEKSCFSETGYFVKRKADSFEIMIIGKDRTARGELKMDRPIKSYDEVKAILGTASPAWEKLTGLIRFHYVIDEIWQAGNPNHKHYNNLYFKRGGKTLVTLAIREGYFIVSVVLGKDERAKFEEQRKSFGEEINKEYDTTEIYHDGKWLGFDIYGDSLIDDVFRLLQIKRKPNRKTLPDDMGKCGCLDIGLSHDDITNYLILMGEKYE